jgi:hypothetical protein
MQGSLLRGSFGKKNSRFNTQFGVSAVQTSLTSSSQGILQLTHFLLFVSAPSAMAECSTLLRYCTVKTVVPFTPFRLALMVVVPLEALLASPFDLIVATVTSDEVHVT